MRALAVTSLKRASAVPDMPTMAEQGFPGFDATAWFGVLAPAGTPVPVVARLQAETVKILAMPDVRKKFADLGMETIGNTPAQFAEVIKAEIPVWAQVIKEFGAKATE